MVTALQHDAHLPQVAADETPARPHGGPSRAWMGAAAISSLVHAAIVVVLGTIAVDAPRTTTKAILDAAIDPPESVPPLLEKLPEQRPPMILATASISPTLSLRHGAAEPPPVPRPKPAAARRSVVIEQVDADILRQTPLLAGVDAGKYKAKLGQVRSRGQRLQAVLYRGGSLESEKAVDAALVWLAQHQAADGGWSFAHHTTGDCGGKCRNPGSLANARIAATALAMLPFLAAGETHQQGRYKKQLEAGLKFLIRNMQVGGALTQGGGTMYAQALATVVLCESAAMTRDRDLTKPAQLATGYILAAQDVRGGGWRYFPGMPGDTSVTGWQVMALKSADNAYYPVPPVALERVRSFLDYVQQDEGAEYGYVGPEKGTTASTPVGLLCRMQLGWKHDEPALVRGVETLAAKGPLPNNIYYNFYATQVLHHYGGPHWTSWNQRMRGHLVATQVRQGHETGSWYFEEKEPEDALAPTLGGRLYSTALAALTLEVYYRYLPLYGNRMFPGESVVP